MTGAFALWQPEYAARGVATFPVRDKRPAVGNYQKMGRAASDKLVRRFANDDAFGASCARAKLTVVDVDARDENLLADCLTEYGETPFIVRTPSGFHAWYRNNGEGRSIRPNPDKPVDILGGNGFVVAPHSIVTKGSYDLIAGTLDDLKNLPIMRSTGSAKPSSAKLHQGKRNSELFRRCLKEVRQCGSLEQLMSIATEANKAMFYEPLPSDEVLRIVASAWDKESRNENWVGTSGRVVVEADLVDTLGIENPDALILYMQVKRHNYGRPTFYVANGMAEMLQMPRKRFTAARAALERMGLLHIVKRRTRHTPDIYSFKGGRN